MRLAQSIREHDFGEGVYFTCRRCWSADTQPCDLGRNRKYYSVRVAQIILTLPIRMEDFLASRPSSHLNTSSV